MNNFSSTEGLNQMASRNTQHPFRSLCTDEVPADPSSWPLEILLNRWNSVKSQQEDKFASVLEALGKFGPFQRRLVALAFVPNMLSAFFMFADPFTLAAQKPYCNTSWILAVGPHLSEAEQLNLTLPREADGSYLPCLMYTPVSWDLHSISQFGLNHTQLCQSGWIYPESRRRSLINEFDLVCGQEPRMEVVQTVLTAGLLVGSIVFGHVCDKLGRHPAILLSLLGLLVFGFGTAFVSSFPLYLFFRFCVSQAVVGYAISSVALATEWLTVEYRAHAVVLAHCFFAVGLLFLMGLAYSLPHWRLLLLVGGAPMFPLISYIWTLPESPRWLLLKGKATEAKQLLCHAAAVNEKTIPLSLLDKLHLPAKKVAKVSVLDFYSNRHLRKVTLVMSCVWFAVSYSCFTLGLREGDVGRDVSLRNTVPCVVEVPAHLCSIFLLEHVGRKWSLMVTLLQSALMFLLILLLPQELKAMLVVVLVLGKFSLSACVTVLFLYMAELCPTVLRATGLGLVSLAAAVGGISALMILLVTQGPSLLPISLCCVLALLALLLSSQLPETQNRPFLDTLEQLRSALSFQRSTHQGLDLKTRSDILATEDSGGEHEPDAAAAEDVAAAEDGAGSAQVASLRPAFLPAVLFQSAGQEVERHSV